MNRILLISLSLVVTGSALAQQGRPGPEVLFKRLDKNGDGFISSDELPSERRPNLKRIDTDGDGKISLKEHLSVLGNRPSAPQGRPIPRRAVAHRADRR